MEKQSNTCDDAAGTFLGHFGTNINFLLNNNYTLNFTQSDAVINDESTYSNYDIDNNSLSITFDYNSYDFTFIGDYNQSNHIFTGTFSSNGCNVDMTIHQ